MPSGTNVETLPAWRDGAIEVQDEGSQLLALLLVCAWLAVRLALRPLRQLSHAVEQLQPGKDAPTYAAAAKLKGVGVRRGGAATNKLDNIVEDRGVDKD